MSSPVGDVTENYLQMMRERGWTFDDLADHFRRQSESPQLDGGAADRNLERWARSLADAARGRREAAAPEQPPVDPRPEPPKRTATPPPKRRAGATASGVGG